MAPDVRLAQSPEPGWVASRWRLCGLSHGEEKAEG